MNPRQSIRTALGIGGFCARHLLATLVTVVCSCVLWTIIYLALLLWAVITGSGIGGPLAYPGGLLFVFVAATAASLLLLFPSTALAEWFARRRGLPILARIPISMGLLALLCIIAAAVTGSLGVASSFRHVAIGFGVLFISCLLPLGLYWWTAQSGPILLSLLRRRRGD
jgi:hypothetical protein